MTPKEKSWELYNTYRTLEGKFGGKILYNYDAKQCALIAVNELIKETGKKYWYEVKNELEKL